MQNGFTDDISTLLNLPQDISGNIANDYVFTIYNTFQRRN
jgi:hypothetical protein